MSDDFTAEDIATAEKAGLSVEDLKKYGSIKVLGDPEAISNWTAEDIVMAQKAGLTVEDLKKYGPKGKGG